MGNKEIDLATILNELGKTKNDIQNTVANNSKALLDKVSELKRSVNSTNEKLDQIISTVNDHAQRIVTIEETLEDLKPLKPELQRLAESSASFQVTQDKSTLELKSRIDYLESENRRANLVISGIREHKQEDRTSLAKTVNDILNDLLGYQINLKPHQIFRRGQIKENIDRKIVVKLGDPQIKIDLLKLGHKLAGSKIYLSADFTPIQEKTRYYLRQFLREKGKGKFIANFTVEIEGDHFIYNETENRVEIKK